MKDEILIVKKERTGFNSERHLKFKITNKGSEGKGSTKYEKVIANKDFNLLAYLFYDLYNLGYNIPKAYDKFKQLLNEPELFFLR